MFQIHTSFRVNGAFIPFNEFTGEIEDANYIEGAIEMSSGAVSLITTAEWDYVDQLWGYFATGLQQVVGGQPFSTYFPDQPIEVRFIPTAQSQVEVTVKVDTLRAASIDSGEFVRVMAAEGHAFFTHLADLLPENVGSYAPLIARLAALK